MLPRIPLIGRNTRVLTPDITPSLSIALTWHKRTFTRVKERVVLFPLSLFLFFSALEQKFLRDCQISAFVVKTRRCEISVSDNCSSECWSPMLFECFCENWNRILRKGKKYYNYSASYKCCSSVINYWNNIYMDFKYSFSVRRRVLEDISIAYTRKFSISFENLDNNCKLWFKNFYCENLGNFRRVSRKVPANNKRQESDEKMCDATVSPKIFVIRKLAKITSYF